MSQNITADLRRWVRERLDEGMEHQRLMQLLTHAGWGEREAEQAIRTARRVPLAGADAARNTAPTPASAPVDRPAQTASQRTGEDARTAAQPAPPLPFVDLERSPREIHLPDRTVQVLLSLSLPRVVVLANFLSDTECDALIAAARPRLARSLTVQTATGGEELNPDRTSQGMFFNRGETPLVRCIEARIAALLNWPVDNGEGMQVLHYGPGAQYRPHYDYFDTSEPGTPNILRRGGQRLGTLLMYLNNPEQGGGTTFPDVGLEVMPQRGHAVFFSYDSPSPSTRSLHGGAPVIEGDKWIATKWLRERMFS